MITLLAQPPLKTPAYYRGGVRFSGISDRNAEDLQIRAVVQYRTTGGAAWRTAGTHQKVRFDFDFSRDLQSLLTYRFLTGATTGLSSAGANCAFEYQVVFTELYTTGGLLTYGDTTTSSIRVVYNTSRPFVDDDSLAEFLIGDTVDALFLSSVPRDRTVKTNGLVQLDFLCDYAATLHYQKIWPVGGLEQTSALLTPLNGRGVASFSEAVAGEIWQVWIRANGRNSEVLQIEHQGLCEPKELAFMNKLGGIDRLVWSPEYIVGSKVSRGLFRKPLTGGLLSEEGLSPFSLNVVPTLVMIGGLDDSTAEYVNELLESSTIWLYEGGWFKVQPKEGDIVRFNSEELAEGVISLVYGHDKITPL
jgi:hypothetical protein